MTHAFSQSPAYPMLPVAVVCTALLVSSCSFSRHSQEKTPELAQTTPTQPAPHLAQRNFGHQAEFGLCMPPACPAVTPKTLAPPSIQRAALPETRSPATASTLDAGEEIVPASPRITAVAPSQPRLAAAPATKTVTVHFSSGDASLSAAGETVLDSTVAEAPDPKRIVVSGRTDSTGPARINEALAAARARAVRDYLRTRHPRLVPVLKLDAQGACCYVAPNDTAQGPSLNRRVEVTVSHDEEPLP